MIQKTHVFLRADGNNKIGLGHIHRLLALCEILKVNFDCKFVVRSPLAGIRKLINKNCGEIIELDDSPNQSSEIFQFLTGKEIVVIDGYNFDTTYQQSIKQKGNILICIDDLHQHHFVADVIINPAGGLNESLYSMESKTKLFLGPKFSLLKKPFLEAAKNSARKSIVGNSILLCMGGADPNNHTLSILKRCLEFSFDSYQVVVGEAYRHRDELQRTVGVQDRDIQIISNLEPQMLASVMKRCAVAVCSASGIAYEYLSVGGELYVEQTATNQADLFAYLIESKLAFKFENFRVEKHAAIESFQVQRKIFDGNSDKRILKIFNRLDLNLHGKIRRATTHDLMTTFHWANDPELRSQSFDSKQISLENHISWFNKKLSDSATFLYIYDYKNIPIGQIRFDIDTEATISYSIDHSFRGRGWGQTILQIAIKTFLKERQQSIKIIGYVKRENVSSSVIFKNLGFTRSIAQEHPNSYKYELIKL